MQTDEIFCHLYFLTIFCSHANLVNDILKVFLHTALDISNFVKQNNN